MIVLKFGGSSLANLENLKTIKTIIQSNAEMGHQLIVIVSAIARVTDNLIEAVHYAEQGEYNQCRRITDEIKQRYLQLYDGAKESEQMGDQGTLFEYLHQLDSILYGLSLTRDTTPRIMDTIVGYGELLSSWLVEQLMKPNLPGTECLDTRGIIITDNIFGNANINWDETTSRLKTYYSKKEDIPLIIATGFIASTIEGITTTIGRNGSDYTASIIGSVLDAKGIYIYTDVDGVLSADPRYVEEAFPLTELSYEEAIDLAFFGAEVLHPKTMIPAMQRNIPIYIKNTFKPDSVGTVISNRFSDESVVKTVTSIDDLCLINLEWNLIIPGSDYTSRLLGIFKKLGLDPWLMNIAPFSQSICFAIRKEKEQACIDEINVAFEKEIRKEFMKPVRSSSTVGLVSIVGDNVARSPKTSKKLFEAVNKVGADILAISQGLSHRMISIAVNQGEIQRVVGSIHTAFNLSRQEIHVIQYGKGLVGKTLLNIIRTYNEKNRESAELPIIKHVAISGKSKTLFNPKGINLDTYEQQIEKMTKRLPAEEIIQQMLSHGLSNIVLLDVTDSDTTVDEYGTYIQAGVHLVSSNKKPFTIELTKMRKLMQQAKAKKIKIGYETTVGAGLPVIEVIQSLLKTGDQIEKIEGVFSGSLNYICSSMEQGVAFSEAVQDARKKGFTEPHPGEDLSGRDMARKALILARELSINANFEDLALRGLVGDEVCELEDMDSFWDALKQHDAMYKDQIAKLEKENKTLRFTASITRDEIVVGLKEVNKNEALGSLKGAENIVVITSKFYQPNPLVVKGPGAGAEVTAAGAFSDILSIARQLP
jgi:bifunctional aspartokinase / homoserine dehydrogenase 1